MRPAHRLRRRGLCARFRTVFLAKPTLSRPTNSERYLVCEGFSGKRGGDADATETWWKAVRPIVDAMLEEQRGALVRALDA